MADERDPVAARVGVLARVVRLAFPASARRRLRMAMFDWLDLRWTTARGVELRVAAYGDWVVYNEIFVAGEYDRAVEAAFAAHTDGPMRVLDLGANVGYFTLRVFDEARRRGLAHPLAVTAIEGDERSLRAFAARVLDANGLAASVTLVPGLVGERGGVGFLPESGPSASVVSASTAQGSRPIPYVDLNALLRDAPSIHLLKADIEGSELPLLRNHPELLRKVQVAIFELHHTLCDTEECRRLLREAGLGRQDVLRSDDTTAIVLARR